MNLKFILFIVFACIMVAKSQDCVLSKKWKDFKLEYKVKFDTPTIEAQAYVIFIILIIKFFNMFLFI